MAVNFVTLEMQIFHPYSLQGSHQASSALTAPSDVMFVVDECSACSQPVFVAKALREQCVTSALDLRAFQKRVMRISLALILAPSIEETLSSAYEGDFAR